VQRGLTTVAPYGRSGASARVRVVEWVERLGLDAQAFDYLGLPHSRPWALLRDPAALLKAEHRIRRLAARPPQVLLLHREASPLSRGGLESALLSAAAHGVYDFDDALQWDHGRGPIPRRLAPKSGKCLAAVRAADRVIAGNPLLADWACEWARDVVVIPSCVDPNDYVVKTDHALHDPPRLGWVGSPTTERYLQRLAPALLEGHRRWGARLTVVSSGTAALGPLDVMVDRVEWSEGVVAPSMVGWDVAIAPLGSDLLARGKCAYKLLQYAAAGLPVVGSPVGANRQVLEAIAGLPASSIDDWGAALAAILEAPESERADRGARARAAVTRDYSYDAWATTWLAAVELTPTQVETPA
jgi:glycosyltransferase involved in cell wall biosynthesis